MSLIRHKLYLAVALAHFTVDVFSSMGPVLVTFLSIPMALSAAQIGLAIGAYQLIAAATQPFFGWLSDKIGSRWLGSVSVPWTVGFLAIAVFIAQTTNNFMLFLIPFGLAAVGSGAFHPQGAVHAATVVASRAAAGTAVFFLFGQAGLAGGPMLAGLILDTLGPPGIYGAAVISIPVLLFIAYTMLGLPKPTVPTSSGPAKAKAIEAVQIRWGAIALLTVLIGLRSWFVLGTASFLPKIFQDMDWDAASYGLITGTYWLTSGIAGVLAGNLADRWGRRQIVFGTLFLGSMPLYFLPLSNSWLAFPLTIIAGGLLGASHSILVVIAQALLPGRKAFATGLTLGYMFGAGAVAVWGIGALADVWGLTVVIQAGAGIGLLTAGLSLALPATREAAQPQPEGAPA